MGITQGHVVLWSRLWMFLNNGPEVLDAIGPLLQLGIRSAQPVVGDQRHIFFVEQLKQERQSLGSFLTQLCAIVGGCFTVFGLIDSALFYGVKAVKQD